MCMLFLWIILMMKICYKVNVYVYEYFKDYVVEIMNEDEFFFEGV